MYNDNHNDIYDNIDIRNKNLLDLSFSNVNSNDWWLEWLRRKKINIRKTSVTLNELMTCKENTTTLKWKPRQILRVFNVLLLKSLAKGDCS